MIKLKKQQIKLGGWKNLSRVEKQTWLRMGYKLHQVKQVHHQKSQIIIEGNTLFNAEDFFCCIGEQVNGLVGYFGRSYAALEDCLSNGACWGVSKSLCVIWLNYTVTKRNFMLTQQCTQLDWITNILRPQTHLVLVD